MASIKFYFDEMMSRDVANGLIRRDYEVIMAVDVGMMKQDDPVHLQYATERDMVVVTQDDEFAGLTAKRVDHAGLICWTGKDDDIGGMVRKLSAFADEHILEDVFGQVFWIK